MILLLMAVGGGEAVGSADGVADGREGAREERAAVVADTSICLHPTEVDHNHGGKRVLRLKGNQHVLLMTFAFESSPDGSGGGGGGSAGVGAGGVGNGGEAWRLVGGEIFLHAAGPLKMRHVGLSVLDGAWHEGRSRGPAERGESTYHARSHGTSGWVGPGSTFLDALGKFHYAEIVPAGDGGGEVYRIRLPDSLVREIGGRRSVSLAITDEQGQTMWNNDFYSREERGREPYMMARFGRGEVGGASNGTDEGDVGSAGGAADGRSHEREIEEIAARVRAAGLANGVSHRRDKRDVAARGGSFELGGLQLRVTTPYDDVHPLTGRSRPESAADVSGRLWDGNQVRLHAGRNWFSAFQLVVPVEGRLPRPMRWESFVDSQGGAVEGISGRLLWVWYIRGEDESKPGWHGGPLLGGMGHLAAMGIEGQRFQGVYCELYVRHDVRPGVYRSSVTIVVPPALRESRRAGAGGEIRIPVELTVHAVRLSDELGYKLSLNTYGSPGGYHGAAVGTKQFERDELEYHRLAHEHRATLATVPYSQSGVVGPGMAPRLTIDASGEAVEADWSRWDARWERYFTGEAFADLPRAGRPIDHFYLPLHENWPLPLDKHYKWAGRWETHWEREGPLSEGLSLRYQRGWRSAVQAFVEHLDRPAWGGTQFQVYLNNKWSFKRDGGSGSSYWDLDEPAHRNDHLALAHFAEAFQESGGRQARHIVFRADISRPQFERGLLRQMDDLRICNAWRQWPEQSLKRGQLPSRPLTVWSYGESDPPGSPLVNQWTWCVEAYGAGCDGMVPWQSLGRQDSWNKAEGTSLIYPARSRMPQKPLAGLRLKALRDAQQDIELLRMLTGENRGEAEDEGESQNWGNDRARLIMALTGAAPYGRGGVKGAPLVTADLSGMTAGDVLELREKLLKALSGEGR